MPKTILQLDCFTSWSENIAADHRKVRQLRSRMFDHDNNTCYLTTTLTTLSADQYFNLTNTRAETDKFIILTQDTKQP